MSFVVQARQHRKAALACHAAVAWSCLASVPAAWAQANRADQEILRQQERERALREQQERQADVRRGGVQAAPVLLPTSEQPCFRIDRIELVGEGAPQFAWAADAANPGHDPSLGRCLGTEGVNLVMTRVQNSLIARGYITTRVLAAPQNLTTGTLQLTVVPGRLRAVKFAEGTPKRATIGNALPAKVGALLNLRDIEQGIENFKRVPTVAADIQIVPAEGEGAQPGQSDLLISWKQARRLRYGLTLDDSGSASTGKLQAGATLSVDDALNANDLFYVNVGHDAFNGGNQGTRSWTAHYDLPLGYWLIGATVSQYRYHQRVAGAFDDYVYSGSSGNAELRVSHLFYRNATVKFSGYARAWSKGSKNFIDDTEVQVQRRRTGGWEAGLTWRHFVGQATVDASLAYRRGTGAFDSLPAPEEVFGEGTSRMQIITADAQLSVPFQLGRQVLRYTGSWRAQWNRTSLTGQERFAIGGRYTVRGFDGEMSLSGDHGWLWRNDMSLELGGGQEFYAALDYGHIGGPTVPSQLSNHLMGLGLGLRGGWRGGYWDFFVGAPLNKPDGYLTAYTTAAFNLGWNF